ncbi:hypothetical protein [Halobiforma nitratireducens]|uniref:Peptidase M50 n=1 Tax=Halobiforma nitratireducens JCM 10879 TaxID=1227454 RepID=M0M5Q3_9EURY|nr:hypothetical protein [Halobiforma nitratireducens]EMA41137.1 hypothetical protein C446_06255 [Halobiforma nitratireducens JCM 10879]
MIEPELVVAGFALLGTVALGLVVHEWTHAVVLRLGGIDYAIAYAPNRGPGVLGVLASCPWAVVRPRPTGREPAWVLRCAALAPLVLAVPVFLVGVAGDGRLASPMATAIAIGWLACSLPSPQDFSVAFYAHRALEDRRRRIAATPSSRAD